jgi:D-alanine-D-alanine ligase
MDRLNLVILLGGKSDEREISLVTGSMIINALDNNKYNVTAIDTSGSQLVEYDDAKRNIHLLLQPLSYITEIYNTSKKPDVAFIALHGKYGEDGTVQGMLELLNIPYVGSGVLSSALAMDKIASRKMMQADGIPIPAGIALDPSDNLDDDVLAVERTIQYPVVVKPSCQGSTIGLSIAKNRDELTNAINTAYKYDSRVLVEQFISGTEITVPVIGNDELQVLPIVEIVPKSGFYDYHAKYTDGETDEIVPARLPESIYKYAEELALKCHKTLLCRGMSRTDMIAAKDEIYVLETNTIPGMTPTSLLPRSAKAAGIEFSDLLDTLITLSLER